MKRSRSLVLPLSCCRTRLSCVSIDSVTSGTSPTSPSACRSASVKAVDLLSLGSCKRSMPRLVMLVLEADTDFFSDLGPGDRLLVPGQVGPDHFRRIDDAVEQLLGHKAELQRGLLQGKVIVHC